MSKFVLLSIMRLESDDGSLSLAKNGGGAQGRTLHLAGMGAVSHYNRNRVRVCAHF